MRDTDALIFSKDRFGARRRGENHQPFLLHVIESDDLGPWTSVRLVELKSALEVGPAEPDRLFIV